MVAGLYYFVVHSLTSANPIINLRLLRDRNYAVGMLLVFLYGLLTLAPMVLMPPLLAGSCRTIRSRPSASCSARAASACSPP